MRESVAETLIGFMVLIAAAAFAVFAINTGGDAVASSGTYDVTARFNNVSGLSRGSDVRMAGVKIGLVKEIEMDFVRSDAVLTLAIDKRLELAEDADARISTDGLLGGTFIALEQGGLPDNLPTDGTGEIEYTRGSVDLITLFGSAVSGFGEDAEEDAP